MKAVGRYKLQSRHKKSSDAAHSMKSEHHCRDALHTKFESVSWRSHHKKRASSANFFLYFTALRPSTFINKEPQLEPKSEQVAVSLTLHELTNVLCSMMTVS